MKKIRRTLLIFLLLLLSGGGFYFSHRKGNTTPISAQEIHLNTLVTVTLYGTDRTELLDGAFALCDHYEKLFSRTLPESEIYRLNHGEISEVSLETSELIQIGLSYGELSEGALRYLHRARLLPLGFHLRRCCDPRRKRTCRSCGSRQITGKSM